MYRTASAAVTTDTGTALTASYTYTDDLLTAIQTSSTTYSFSYGDFALRTGVSIGSRTLATYRYNEEAVDDRRNDLDALDYGNGDRVQYTYDDQGRVTQETYENGDTVSYRYDNSGALATVTDSATGTKSTYYYDFTDRLMKYVESSGSHSLSVGCRYDDINNLTQLVETINGVERTTSYTYDEDNRIIGISDGVSSKTYTYDEYGCITAHDTSYEGNEIVEKHLGYHYTEDGRRTNQVASSYAGSGAYSHVFNHSYDDNGNISWILVDYTDPIYYSYDSANQLIREDNGYYSRTWTWIYDDAGNITSWNEYHYTTGELGTPISTKTYTYGDSQWGDLLTAFNGSPITYDAVGNPLSDGTWTYTWEHGRQLASMTGGGTTWSYDYNSATGMRTKRTNGSTTYSYVYSGSQLVQMTVDGNTLRFAYDAYGEPFTVTCNGATYYYVTNLQGDVIFIVNSNREAVAEYLYDSWGNAISVYSDADCPVAAYNPLRYRGYVYDIETGLYYLQSRYYNPNTGRFINADAYASTGQGFIGNNMFAYCNNNPMMFVDKNGLDAIVLYDQDTFGHIGIMVQDANGTWWHFYWGTRGGVNGSLNRVLCFFGVSVGQYTWCKKYTAPSTSLKDINNAGQYAGEYERRHYLKGDFSECVDELKNPTGNYNLYTNNCSQVSLSILASVDTKYQKMLQKASSYVLPSKANEYITNLMVLSKIIPIVLGKFIDA